MRAVGARAGPGAREGLSRQEGVLAPGAFDELGDPAAGDEERIGPFEDADAGRRGVGGDAVQGGVEAFAPAGEGGVGFLFEPDGLPDGESGVEHGFDGIDVESEDVRGGAEIGDGGADGGVVDGADRTLVLKKDEVWAEVAEEGRVEGFEGLAGAQEVARAAVGSGGVRVSGAGSGDGGEIADNGRVVAVARTPDEEVRTAEGDERLSGGREQADDAHGKMLGSTWVTPRRPARRDGKGTGLRTNSHRFLALALAAGLAPAAPAFAQDEQPAPAEAANGDTIDFTQFSEPINLVALLDYVSKELEINFVLEDPGLGNAQVEFRAPMRIQRDELLPIFESILGMYGYAIVQNPQGVYIVTQGSKLPVQFEGELPSTRIFSTPLIKPSALQQAINNALSQDQSAAARISAVDDLGVLISTAPGPINRTIESIINQLVSSRDGWSFHRVDLTHLAATQAQQRLVELAGQVAPSVANQQPGQPGAVRSVSGALVNIGERLLLDHASNAIIFRGTRQEADQVRDLVSMIDTQSTLIVRRYNAGAMSAQIARMGERQGLGGVDQSGGGGPSRGGASMGSGFELPPGQDGATFFTYYGTQQQHARVKALVDEFADQARLESMVVEFYKLEHADAEEASELLRELLELEAVDDFADSPFLPPSLESSQRNIRRTEDIVGDVAPPAPGAEGEQTLTPVEGIQILADTAANQLVVRAPVRQQQEIETIIERIDSRRPQVYLDFVIIAVSRSKDFSITIDTVLTDPDSDFPTFSNFGLLTDPRNTTINPVQGFTSAFIRNDYVPIIINALETKGDGRVLSEPKILVKDNQEATLNSTRNEPFAQTSQTVGTPNTTSLGGTISAGTIIAATPQISSGGFLELELSVESSSFDFSAQLPDLPPPTTSDNISSVVTVPSGATVVIGGLVTRDTGTAISQIPILGDIPVIGELFKDRVETESVRTLYIFITPRILRDENFGDLRLLTEGPLADVEIEDRRVPELEPVEIPLLDRAFPVESAPETGEALGSR